MCQQCVKEHHPERVCEACSFIISGGKWGNRMGNVISIGNHTVSSLELI